MTCVTREKSLRPLYLLEKNTYAKHQNFTQYSKQMQKLITPKREHKLSVRNRQLLAMLWLRTYPTSYMLSAMFGVSKSTDENVITELTLILFANLKRYIKRPSLREWWNFRGNWEKSPMPAIRYRRNFS